MALRRKCPYLTRYGHRGTPEADWGWYAVFRENGVKKRKSLRTRNQRIAGKRFLEFCDRLDRGILGFSLRPRILPFGEAARTFLNEGTMDLARASVDRHRQNLFGLRIIPGSHGEPKYQEGEGHLIRYFRTRDLKTIGVKDVARFVRHRQSQCAAANTILRELATLSAIFRHFMTEELVLSNPVLAVKKPKLKLVRRSKFRAPDIPQRKIVRFLIKSRARPQQSGAGAWCLETWPMSC